MKYCVRKYLHGMFNISVLNCSGKEESIGNYHEPGVEKVIIVMLYN